MSRSGAMSPPIRFLVSLLALFALLPHTAAAQDTLILDPGYAPSIPEISVHATALQDDGKLLIGGDFVVVNGTARERLARLNLDGTLDTGFANGIAINGIVTSVVVVPEGILIGGHFSQVNGIARAGIARLNTVDGTLDSTFTPPAMTADATARRVRRVLPLTQGANAGKILVAGNFANIGNASPARMKIARLNANGTLDTTFAAHGFAADASINTLAETADGRLLIGGQFSGVSLTTRWSLARLSSSGAVDPSFTIGVSGTPATVNRIVVQPDGKIVVAGDFSAARNNSGGTTNGVLNLARFNTDFSVDTAFTLNTGTNSAIYWMEQQVDGALLIGGSFTSVQSGISSNPRSKLARIGSNGVIDSGFTPATINGNVQTLLQQADGRIFVGGSFSMIGGAIRNRLARLGAPMTGTEEISAGYSHTCAIRRGAAVCWGSNFNGELGNGSTVASSVPVQVSGLTSGVTAISSGSGHTCAIHNGAAKCWGDNGYGELGNINTADINPVPVQVSGLTSGVTAISAGGSHTCAVHNGAAKCWGSNAFGQLGNGTLVESYLPVPVSGLGSGVTGIDASIYVFSCAIHNGAAKCWGYNAFGQLGNGTLIAGSTPVPVSGLNADVTLISVGTDHACARHAGVAKCWGRNDAGQLGTGNQIGSSVPVQVSNLGVGPAVISAGRDYTCAILGLARCWGLNMYGQLGDGTIANSPVPTTIPNSVNTTRIDAGFNHACAIQNGVAKCWGNNEFGQIGNGTSGVVNNSSAPVPVLAPPPLSDLIFANGFE